MIVTIIIDGPAVAKARPRITRKGIAYTPAATRKYEAHGRLAAQLAMNGRPPITSPVSVVMRVELPIPASWSARRRAAATTGNIRPTGRPDLDNFIKAALDVLLSELRRELVRKGESRFPYVRHHFDEKQQVANRK
jgi:Holliday junction resolvase RusA-like endonuclease